MMGEESERLTLDPGGKIRWMFRSPAAEQEGKDKGSEIDGVTLPKRMAKRFAGYLGVAEVNEKHTGHAAIYVDLRMQRGEKIRKAKEEARAAKKTEKLGTKKEKQDAPQKSGRGKQERGRYSEED